MDSGVLLCHLLVARFWSMCAHVQFCMREQVRRELSVTTEEVIELFVKFKNATVSAGGRLDIVDFCLGMGIHYSPQVQAAFDLVDSDQDGYVYWEDAVTAMRWLTPTTLLQSSEGKELVRHLYDKEVNGSIEVARIRKAVLKAEMDGWDEERVADALYEWMYRQKIATDASHLDYAQFDALVAEEPVVLQAMAKLISKRVKAFGDQPGKVAEAF